MTHGPETRTWRQKTPYQPKPHAGQNLSPTRGDKGFYENWMDRMAERMTLVEVRCSTEPQPFDQALHSYSRHESPDQAFQSVKVHMQALDELGALQPGVWTITMPGTDRRHSFEVE